MKVIQMSEGRRRGAVSIATVGPGRYSVALDVALPLAAALDVMRRLPEAPATAVAPPPSAPEPPAAPAPLAAPNVISSMPRTVRRDRLIP